MSSRVQWLATILVTAISFAVISASRPHYQGGRVEIKMAVSNRTPVFLRWDSGEGFNKQEETVLVFGITEPLPFEDHVLKIRNHGEALARNQRSMVLIRDIILDGSKRLNLISLTSPGNAEFTDGGLLNVMAGGGGLEISAAFSSVEIVFVKGPFAGEAGIEIDDDKHIQELWESYVEPIVYRIEEHVVEGVHTLTRPLPRSDLLGFEIEPVYPDHRPDLRGLKVVTDAATVDVPITGASEFEGGLRFSEIDLQMRAFSVLLIAVQLFVSLVLGAMFFTFLSLPEIVRKPDWKTTLRYLSLDDQRWMWWLMFLSTAGVFTFWLLGQWPGAMQNDSFAQWMQLKTLEINNVLPWMYTMGVLAATQLANTPAAVSSLQIFVSAIIGSTIFFFALRAGVSRMVVAVFWFLFSFSIPIGLYNVTMFKDVPFAQCTLLWAFFLFWLWLHKEDRGPMVPDRLTLFVLAALLMGFLVRHNGFLFVFGIPLLILATGLFERKRAVRFVLVSWLMFVVLQFGLATLIGAHGRTDYCRLEFWMKAGPLFGLFANPGGYHTDDPVGDWQRIEQFVTVETIKGEYRRGSFEPMFYRHRSEDAVDLYRDLSALYDKRVAANAPILVGDKAYLFATIIGPFRETYLWSNDLRDRRFLRNRLWWNRRFFPRWGEMTMLHTLEHSPKWVLAYEIQERIWERSRQFAGLGSGRFVYWNAIVPFVLLIFFAAAYRWFPATALFSIVVLFQVPFVALAATAYHYRFIFFVHYCGFFVVPLALAEIRHRRVRATGSTHDQAESNLSVT